MKILNAIGVSALLIVALTLGSTESFSQDPESASQVEQSPSQAPPCKCRENHTIQVRVDNAGKPVLRYRGGLGDEVHVNKGDTVRWVVIGANRQFSVDFKSEKGAPFGTPPGEKRKRDSQKYEIKVDISMSAEGNGTVYEYDIGFADGDPGDPQIIVE